MFRGKRLLPLVCHIKAAREDDLPSWVIMEAFLLIPAACVAITILLTLYTALPRLVVGSVAILPVIFLGRIYVRCAFGKD